MSYLGKTVSFIRGRETFSGIVTFESSDYVKVKIRGRLFAKRVDKRDIEIVDLL